MLRQNYRAHPALVEIASEMCYNGNLLAALPIKERDSLSQWKYLPQTGFPLIWHCTYGKEKREQDGTSYYNSNEIKHVIFYIDRLLEVGVKPKEIGVISPYKYQVNFLNLY